jgi:hypothetical protein
VRSNDLPPFIDTLAKLELRDPEAKRAWFLEEESGAEE